MSSLSDAYRVGMGFECGSLNARHMLDIVQTANKFKSSIVLHAENKTVDVKSFLGLSITIMDNKIYKLEIHGDDEDVAKQEMLNVFTKLNIPVVVN